MQPDTVVDIFESLSYLILQVNHKMMISPALLAYMPGGFERHQIYFYLRTPYKSNSWSLVICNENKFNLFHTNISTDMKPGLKIFIHKIQAVTNEFLTFRGSKHTPWGLKHNFLKIYETRNTKSVHSIILKALRWKGAIH